MREEQLGRLLALQNKPAIASFAWRVNKYINYIFSSIPATKGYKGISHMLENKGYTKGFSMAALGYDFKESECDNNQFKTNIRVHTEDIIDAGGMAIGTTVTVMIPRLYK